MTDNLENMICKGFIQVKDEEFYISIIEENFPFTGSKIAWSKVTGAVSERFSNKSFSKESINFSIGLLSDNCIGNDEGIVIVGDNLMNNAYQTKVRYLEQVLEEVLDIPQHIYVISENGRWCMVFSLEGYVDFGFSTQS
ncbi:MAG: hypothetical protein NE330_09085 [Lentisphaeraceae bacterium]|nr:hypothetical protein [Lentisphaeraceae bacterium]